MSFGEFCKDNSILLTLPKVSLGETESEAGDEKVEIPEIERDEDNYLTFSTFSGQLELNKRQTDMGLQDVYKLLAQLPSSYTMWGALKDLPKVVHGRATNTKHQYFQRNEKRVSSASDMNQTEETASVTQQSKHWAREPFSMHSINLFQNVLPPNMFSRRK